MTAPLTPAPAAPERLASTPTPDPSAQRRGPRPGQRALLIIRRTHMYLGIALLPWVLLYGLTALLFNHSDWFTGARLMDVEPVPVEGATILGLPEPEQVAREAAVELASLIGAPVDVLPGSERWLGSVSLNARLPEGPARVSLEPTGRGGVLRVTPRDPDDVEPAWADAESLGDWSPLDGPAREAVLADARELLASRDLELERLSLRRLPATRFRFLHEGREWVCDVAMDGEVELAPADERVSTRSRLLRLHVAHGDPGYVGARSVWARLVDVMGVAMIGWALSGLVMWWPLRRTRKAGLVALASGLAAMAVMAAWYWRATGSL